MEKHTEFFAGLEKGLYQLPDPCRSTDCDVAFWRTPQMYRVEFTHINGQAVELMVIGYAMTAACGEEGNLM